VSPGFLRRNNTVTSDYYRNQVGHHLGEFFGFVFKGLYRDQKTLIVGKYGSASAVGTIKMQDVNKDGVIDDNDRTLYRDPNPNFIFGMTNNFRCVKNFDLAITMSGSQGGHIPSPPQNGPTWPTSMGQGNAGGDKESLAQPPGPRFGCLSPHVCRERRPSEGVSIPNGCEDGLLPDRKEYHVRIYLAGEPVAIRLPKDQGLSFGQQVYNFTRFTGQSQVQSQCPGCHGLGIGEDAYPYPEPSPLASRQALK